MVGHIFRYNNALNYLKNLIENKDLGRIYYLTSNRYGLRVPRKDSGAIFNYAIHDIDILNYLLNKEYPLEVAVMSSTFFNEGKLGVEKDFAVAAAWFRKAAEKGLSGAQYELGMMYKEGRGVQKDSVKAVEWLGKAAKQGNVHAQSLLDMIQGQD